MNLKLEGVIPPMVTPFDRHEELDRSVLEQEIEYLLDHDIDGLSIGGSTGEGVLLSDAEIADAVGLIQKHNRKRVPVIAGVIRNSTREAVRAGLLAKDAGADALLVTPVFYHGATDQGNLEYYRCMAEKVELPILIYNVVPSNTITPTLMRQLLQIDQVVGVKQVDAEMVSSMVSVCEDGGMVFSACDDMLYPTYVSGACGAIAAISTVVPQLCIDQWRAFRVGDQKTAMDLHTRLRPVWDAYNGRPYPGRIKQVLAELGRPVGSARSPILKPCIAELERIRSCLARAGLREQAE